MSKPIVLIVFYSRGGATESLALAAAVGAVQARASIRLRRISDAGEPSHVSETVARMHKEYVGATEADVLAAHALILAAPADYRPSSPEWNEFFRLVDSLHMQNKLNGKIAAVIDSGDRDCVLSFREAVARTGFRCETADGSTASTLLERATALGRRIGAAIMI